MQKVVLVKTAPGQQDIVMKVTINSLRLRHAATQQLSTAPRFGSDKA
jgi:hypothetical protein